MLQTCKESVVWALHTRKRNTYLHADLNKLYAIKLCLMLQDGNNKTIVVGYQGTVQIQISQKVVLKLQS